MQVLVKDEQLSGMLINETYLNFKTEQVTVQDIIAERVTQEVNTYNEKKPDFFQGLIQPSDAEKALNGYKLKTKRLIDAEKQVYVALAAFQKNSYFVLIDNIQAENLNQVVTLKPDTTISFVKLTPLVGG